MPELTMRVAKTLVIGLGSTGTEIADNIAQRVEWELGDLQKAPWIRFLCIETNTAQRSRFQGSADFLSMVISTRDYQSLLEDSRPYDEKIRLSSWADMDTLKRLPGMQVTAGAGNIRMVGRLAFLHEGNYDRVKVALRQRIDELRRLGETEAMERRGPLADGAEPPIEFSPPDELRILVLGTLCGGTCSGLASDFGYFLRSMCQPSDKITAAFTLPHTDLSSALVPEANRYKRNSYAALIELNQYHLANREGEPPIRYPDGVTAKTELFPYDLTFLAVPRTASEEGLEGLHRALADRAFLNVFVPQTDPFAEAVDVPIFDREDRAHVFCSFGLSAVEYPAFQVIEACSKRLVAYALREWQHRPLNEPEQERRLDQIGLTWQHLREALLRSEHRVDLRQQLEQKLAEMARVGRSSAEMAERSLNDIRTRLMEQVRNAVPQNRGTAAQTVEHNLRGLMQARLLGFMEGPAPALQIIRAALATRLQELKAVTPQPTTSKVAATDRALDRLRSYQASAFLRLFLLRSAALGLALPILRDAVRDEMEGRIDSEVARALQTTVPGAEDGMGVLDRVARLLSPVQTRLQNLESRLVKLCNALNDAADRLARTLPPTNGLCIFEPEVGDHGTVYTEYRRCLSEHSGDPTVPWEETRQREAAAVIRTWESLPDAVVPISPTDGDWLRREVKVNLGLDAVPDADLRRMEGQARSPFLRLTSEDVLERWQSQDASVQQAQDAAREAAPFLRVDKARAEEGGRAPIQRRLIAVLPDSSFRARFLNCISGVWQVSRSETCPDPFRAVLLEEWYRFPLSGAPEVLGPAGLNAVECTDFLRFDTRKDVSWRGISQREVQNKREAEELITVGVLAEALEARDGRIVVKAWPPSFFGDPGERYLALDLSAACDMLAREESDLDGRRIDNARNHIRQSIDSFISSCPGDSGADKAKAFVRELDDRLRRGVGAVIPGWSRDLAAQYISRFCARDQRLFSACIAAFPPPQAVVSRLRRNQGDELPKGRIAEKPGLYCPECGGWIGADDQDAARNGWRCYVNPAHYYGMRGTER